MAASSKPHSLQLGVWRVLLPEDSSKGSGSGFSSARRVFWDLLNTTMVSAIADGYPAVARFFGDIYKLNPVLTGVFLTIKLWAGLENVLLLWAASKLLVVVEVGLRDGRLDAWTMASAISIRLLCVVTVAATKWIRAFLMPRLQSRITLHFQDILLRADLRLDIPTSEDTRNTSRANPAEAFMAFEVLCDMSMQLLVLLSEMIFISQQRNGGYIFTGISLLHPLINLKAQRALFFVPHAIYSDNESYKKLQALKKMTTGPARTDVVLGGMAGWIGSEYSRARNALGTTPTEHAWIQYANQTSLLVTMASAVVDQLPMIYWAVSAFLEPSKFSMASIAFLTQYAASVRSTVGMLLFEFGQSAKCITDIKTLYDVDNVTNLVIDGEKRYPRPEWEWINSKGMDIKLKNISFTYPGSKSHGNALVDVSVSIPAGALAVIVGVNGSGKSTFIKLLARLYDVNNASNSEKLDSVILIDGLPIQEYKLGDLRRAQAHLAQDHQLFPLPLRENIGLGSVSDLDNYTGRQSSFDQVRVREAATAGGATQLIDRLKDGDLTVLEPVSTVSEQGLDNNRHKDTKEFIGNIDKRVDVSGGEKQRLIASRTFMRLQLRGVKLLCVDEPSSALDPLGEFELFQRLRESGQGMTKIFVTHRFGHLTKHADVIICMKEGRVAEVGTHQELIQLGGEYAALYNVQAQAFTQ
ncbi:p-loop containing nucleoside triphosphate hydrolase protein [Mycena indigotica]|uniref:p-loop containing nucleoside triphosphate hydrolase protein n=1 Tax=Mycena indigotica TaxID=2126181 RepID=A0A8H6T4G5_9AGAR|nr:p-loop containing nucleoside triphosphate hydrolase protein [Mycena indigotica]KAF7311915.1 p-loop containing nucleoside triphosphate hydrolase protein [Mycena indigotica]